MRLTPKQLQVLDLTRKGFTAVQVAERARMKSRSGEPAYRSVEKMLANLRRDYVVSNTTALIDLAHEEGVFNNQSRQERKEESDGR